MMADEVRDNAPKVSDLLSVRSRVSWGAIIAGAMVALTIYVVLMLLGGLIGIAAKVQGADTEFGAIVGLYTIISLAVAMFFGGWTSSRLAVGEDKIESILYAIILWGVLFLMMIYLVTAGVRTGFTALMGVASGTYTVTDGDVDVDKMSRNLEKAGLSEDQVAQFRRYYNDPIQATKEDASDLPTQDAVARGTAWTLSGVLVSLLVVIMGALVGSGEVPIPVPLIGVKRPVR